MSWSKSKQESTLHPYEKLSGDRTEVFRESRRREKSSSVLFSDARDPTEKCLIFDLTIEVARIYFSVKSISEATNWYLYPVVLNSSEQASHHLWISWKRRLRGEESTRESATDDVVPMSMGLWGNSSRSRSVTANPIISRTRLSLPYPYIYKTCNLDWAKFRDIVLYNLDGKRNMRLVSMTPANARVVHVVVGPEHKISGSSRLNSLWDTSI